MLIRLIIAAVIAVVISGFYQGYSNDSGSLYQIDLVTMASFILATVLSTLLAELMPSNSSSKRSSNTRSESYENNASNNPSPANDEDREEGTVKWFNVSKGFGFITRENGEDIFVHYRSIRGQGRRRLFDGQSVTFQVIDSDKGLQADDVDVLS